MNRDPGARKIAECPSCHKPIFEGHANPWCIECGERFTQEFLADHPLVYQHTPYAGPISDGPSERTSTRIAGSFLILVGVAITLLVAYGHSNYPRQVTTIKMAPWIMMTLSSGIGLLWSAGSKTPGPPGTS